MNTYTSPQAALDDLKEVINQLIEELQLFASRPNPNGAYMDKQNRHIRRLTEIYNGITALHYYDAWTAIEAQIHHLQHLDPNIGGHTIHLHTHPDKKHFSLIKYNPFE